VSSQEVSKSGGPTRSGFSETLPRPGRWSFSAYHYEAEPRPPPDGSWQIQGVDIAPIWFSLDEGERPIFDDLPRHWFRLKAKSEEQAKREAKVLGRKLQEEFWEGRRQAGVPFNRDEHYTNWVNSTNKLQRAVKQLARLRATTAEELNIKAMVLAIAHEAFDAKFWNEPLQNSITRDSRKMAPRAVA
jgi:hypothetical protein